MMGRRRARKHERSWNSPRGRRGMRRRWWGKRGRQMSVAERGRRRRERWKWRWVRGRGGRGGCRSG
jgi:hypothetical protein